MHPIKTKPANQPNPHNPPNPSSLLLPQTPKTKTPLPLLTLPPPPHSLPSSPLLLQTIPTKSPPPKPTQPPPQKKLLPPLPLKTHLPSKPPPLPPCLPTYRPLKKTNRSKPTQLSSAQLSLPYSSSSLSNQTPYLIQPGSTYTHTHTHTRKIKPIQH